MLTADERGEYRGQLSGNGNYGGPAFPCDTDHWITVFHVKVVSLQGDNAWMYMYMRVCVSLCVSVCVVCVVHGVCVCVVYHLNGCQLQMYTKCTLGLDWVPIWQSVYCLFQLYPWRVFD